MKQLLIIYIFTCCSFFGKAQENDFSYIDNSMLHIPTALAGTTDSIASYISKIFKKDDEKCRAAYRWVTYNIKYDPDSMYVFNWGGDPERKVTAALRRKKGVCENYAAVFNEIVQKCGLGSYIISGYTKQSGSLDRAGHSWCAVKIDDEWLLCDPTWDAGYISNTNYFLVAPSRFIESHMPFDPLWQLLDHPISPREFYHGITSHGKAEPVYHYADSVKTFLQLNELQQLETAAERIRKAGVENELTRIQLSYIEMQAGIIYESKDMNDYNAAVDDVNKAMDIYNHFVQYRNNQFMPERPDSEMADLLSPIDKLLISAENKMDKVDKSPVNAQYDTGALRDRLAGFKLKVQEQRDFLKRYLSGSMTERKKLFYGH